MLSPIKSRNQHKIHWFQVKDKKYLFDGKNETIYEIDDLARQVLVLLDQTNNQQEIVRRLKDYFSPEEILAVLSRIDSILENEEAESHIIKNSKTLCALTFHLTHGCNLKCPLCFAGEGLFGGPFSMMSEDTALRALKFLVHNSDGRQKLILTFTGGEPLLNYSVLRKVMNEAEQIRKEQKKNSNMYYLQTV